MEDMYMDLYDKLSRLQWLLQRHHLQKHAEHGPMADATRGQGRVLAMLKIQPEISTKDLSYLLGIRQQSLNELLNKLERSGYVTRTPSEADKRVMVIHLTEKGKKEQPAETDIGDVFSCLNEEEQRTFSEYLQRVIAELEARFGDELDDETVERLRAARERMGNEQFERLLSMKRGGNPFDRRIDGHGPGFGGFRRHPHFGGPGFGGFPHSSHSDGTDNPSVPPTSPKKDPHDPENE